MVVKSGHEVHDWALKLGVPPAHALAVCHVPVDIPSSEIRAALRQNPHLRGTAPIVVVDQHLEDKGYCSVLVSIGRNINESHGPSSLWFEGSADVDCTVVYPERPIKSEPRSSHTNLEEVDMCTSPSPPESYCESNLGTAADCSPPLSIAQPSATEGNDIRMLAQIIAKLGGAKAEASIQQQYHKLKIFSGTKPTPAGEEAFEVWIEYTSQVVEEWTCPELAKRQRLMECLRPPASTTIRLAKDQHADVTAQQMLETLERAYGRTEDEGQLMTRYFNLRQKLGEELSDYLQRIRAVLWEMRKRDQIESTQVNEYCWNQFLRGALPDNSIALMIKCSRMRGDPPCWDELMDEIKRHEAYARLHTPAKVKEPSTSDPTKATGAKSKQHSMFVTALVCPEPQDQYKYPIILGTNTDIVQAVVRAYLKETNELPLATSLLDPVLREECKRVKAVAVDERLVELDFNFGESTLSTQWKERLATQLNQRRQTPLDTAGWPL
ncbi:paraneoplastic antigen Ma1 homolog [Ascaphus truei]|uniref:paraneoplastic antigen Ma1 homolog n=1 Tax=Ascaphus truei TaxID=8439 RepID=UPI003F5AD312